MIPHMESLGLLAAELASPLYEDAVNEEVLRRITLVSWSDCPIEANSLAHVSLFVTEATHLYREIAYVEHGQIHLDTNFLSDNQLPTVWKDGFVPVWIERGNEHELWIPFATKQLLGLMIWVYTGSVTVEPQAFTLFQKTLSLGLQHYLSTRQSRSKLSLWQATTDLSHLIAKTASTDEVLTNLVESGVKVLGFDRSTLFLYDSSGTQVVRAVFFGIGDHTPRLMEPCPTPPCTSNEAVLLHEIPAIWSPIHLNGKLTAALFLDNLYSHDTVPEGTRSGCGRLKCASHSGA